MKNKYQLDTAIEDTSLSEEAKRFLGSIHVRFIRNLTGYSEDDLQELFNRDLMSARVYTEIIRFVEDNKFRFSRVSYTPKTAGPGVRIYSRVLR